MQRGLPTREEARGHLRDLNTRAGRLSAVAVDRPLVLYGAGNLGKLAKAHLDFVGVPIALVVDANAAAHCGDPDWAGVDIAAPCDVPENLKREALLAVSVVTSPFAPLAASLIAAGWRRCVPFYDIAEGFRDRHPLGNGWFGDRLDGDALLRCDAVLDGWADDTSRAHHLTFAAWRLCREEWSFVGAAVDPQSRFFTDEILPSLTARERVLDAGAHHGTYLARFLTVTGGAFEAAWAIEPDEANRTVLDNWVRNLDCDIRARIETHDVLLGAGPEQVRFHAGLGYASRIAATGQSSRDITTIDALGLDPTVIKLHLEGGERSALEGALETIRRHRPIVMATTYHNADGLAETPLWLMSHLDSYSVSMRMHTWCGTGAVVYAVPTERIGS